MANAEFTTPVGRIVGGNLYEPRVEDLEGRPLKFKDGSAREDYFFALAIPKGQEQHWAQTPWGAVIWQAGHSFMANAGNNPEFSWKITDGDSQKPNTKGVRPCDREGYPGHWVLSLSSSYPSKIYNNDGSKLMPEKDAVKPGAHVQAFCNVKGNGSQSKPGVFINHVMVAFQYDGERISYGVDPKSVGFGQGVQVPAGASTVPTGSFNASAVVAAAPVPTPAVPGATAAPLPVPAPAPIAASAPSMPAPPAVAVVPNPGIMTGGIPAVPVAPPVPPAGPQMTAKAAGLTYEQLTAAGWTDAALRAEGYIV